MKKFIPAIIAAVVSVFISGCEDERLDHMLWFYTCESKNETGVSRTVVKMPNSGFEVIANKREFMSSADLERVDLAYVDMPDGTRLIGLQVTCNAKGAKKLSRETAAAMGGWILMKENQVPVGLRNIDMMMNGGKFFIPLEFPEGTDLQQKVEEFNKDISVIAPRVMERDNSLW